MIGKAANIAAKVKIITKAIADSLDLFFLNFFILSPPMRFIFELGLIAVSKVIYGIFTGFG